MIDPVKWKDKLNCTVNVGVVVHNKVNANYE